MSIYTIEWGSGDFTVLLSFSVFLVGENVSIHISIQTIITDMPPEW